MDAAAKHLDCSHEVRTSGARGGACVRCGREVIRNGCGPGFIPTERIDDPHSGWRVCSDGMARWFGRSNSEGGD